MSSKTKSKSKSKRKAPESDPSSGSEDQEPSPPKKDKSPEKKKKKKSSKSAVDSDHEQATSKPTAAEDKDDANDDMIAISDKRYVTVREFRGKPLIDIREYYQSDGGEMKPGKKGISLNIEQWNKLKKVTERVDEQIKKKF